MNKRNKKISFLITREKEQGKELAYKILDVISQPDNRLFFTVFPTISTDIVKPTDSLDIALQNIGKYDIVVFTSVNGVRFSFQRMKELNIDFPKDVKIAVIGEKTAQKVEEYGYKVWLSPKEYTSMELFKAMGDVRGKKLLLLRSKIASKELYNNLKEAGAYVEDVAVYDTVYKTYNPSTVNEVANKTFDFVIFTSPSTFYGLCEIFKSANENERNFLDRTNIVSIGPVTSEAIREKGYSNIIEAKEHTSLGIVKTIQDFLNRGGRL